MTVVRLNPALRLLGSSRLRLNTGSWGPLLIALGVVIRISQYLAVRPLWIDEAMLALSIGARPMRELAGPLVYDQTAPLGFLYATKAVTEALGVSELTLRLLPFLAGSALLVMMWAVARRVLTLGESCAATALAAVCPALVYYSNELKPYGLDAVLTLVLVALTLPILAGSRNRHWQSWALAFIGGTGIWISATSIFVLAGIVVALAADATGTRSGRQVWVRITGIGMAWATSFALAYKSTYSRASHSDYMAQFWADSYVGGASWQSLQTTWELYRRAIWGTIVGPPPFSRGWEVGRFYLGGIVFSLVAIVIGALVVLGARRVSRRSGRPIAALFVGPILACAGASLLHLYPIASRLVVFLVPLLLMLIAAGLGSMADVSQSRRMPVFVVSATSIMLMGVPTDGRWQLSPVQWADTRELVDTLRASPYPTYIYARGVPIWSYYTTDWTHPDTARLSAIYELSGPRGPAFENRLGAGRIPPGTGRSWIIQDAQPALIGVPSGMQWRYRWGFSQRRPDQYWAQNEAARIRDAANPRIWVCFFHFIGREHRPLLRELEALGGVQRQAIERQEAILYLYEF